MNLHCLIFQMFLKCTCFHSLTLYSLLYVLLHYFPHLGSCWWYFPHLLLIQHNNGAHVQSNRNELSNWISIKLFKVISLSLSTIPPHTCRSHHVHMQAMSPSPEYVWVIFPYLVYLFSQSLFLILWFIWMRSQANAIISTHKPKLSILDGISW